MKKVSRFKAAFKGFTSLIKEANRRSIINNILKANELANESELIEIEEKKSAIIVKLATCADSEIKGLIKEFCELVDREEAANQSKKYSEVLNKYLDEEIEIEEK